MRYESCSEAEVILQVFEAVGRDPLIDIAIALHQAASKDEYFTSRKLHPNVDFWSGLIYKAMGFPLDFFPGTSLSILC